MNGKSGEQRRDGWVGDGRMEARAKGLTPSLPSSLESLGPEQ